MTAQLGRVFDNDERAKRGDLADDSVGGKPKSPDIAAGNPGADISDGNVTEPKQDTGADAGLLPRSICCLVVAASCLVGIRPCCMALTSPCTR